MNLDPGTFPRFFEAVHQRPPFRWQARLAAEVVAHGWPASLDIPTGCGKTSALDIALFALACEADKPLHARKAPVRIAFVVDRRLVVDEAFERARRLCKALEKPNDDVVQAVRERLALLSEDGKHPLHVARLRGGMAREPDWARTPSQPTILISTVDQVGSRLLFRGYGLSKGMRPIHAGLLGRDTLILLDEAHLSQPFAQTAKDLETSPWGAPLAIRPFQVVTLSATQTEPSPFSLDAAERADPALAARLRAPKPAKLVDVNHADDDPVFAEAFADTALGLSSLGTGKAQLTAIVVNRVQRARAIREILLRRGIAGDDVPLLIGRSRPVNRDNLMERLRPRVAADRARLATDPPMIVVGTQCIEAGADFDFDALVTEIAPLDSLRQRFGRLNRLGMSEVSLGAVLAARNQRGARADDPIYGTAMRATWTHLQANAVNGAIDFGIDNSEAWIPHDNDRAPLLAPRRNAPLLLPSDIKALSQTDPTPRAEPDLKLFLHGPESGGAEIQLVWRRELDPKAHPDEWKARIEALPPVAAEALSLPITEAKRWLERRAASADIADVEGAPESDGGTDQGAGIRRYLLWRNGEVPTEDRYLRPGDTVLLATEAGGCDMWGWNPRSEEPVDDVLDAALHGLGRHAWRVSPRVPPPADPADTHGIALRRAAIEDVLQRWRDVSDRDVVADLSDPAGPRALFGVGDEIRSNAAACKLERDVQGVPIVISVGRSIPASETELGSAGGNKALALVRHTTDVVAMVTKFCHALQLPTEQTTALTLAAHLHDTGKAHPAFQRYLRNGDELMARIGPPLAKSGMKFDDRTARRRADLPPGARHEVASLWIADASSALAAAKCDPELVLWLVGTHHGYGRPFFKSVAWPNPGDEIRVDLGDHGGVLDVECGEIDALNARWLALREAVEERYGAWGVAHLEAVLRLADHRASEMAT